MEPRCFEMDRYLPRTHPMTYPPASASSDSLVTMCTDLASSSLPIASLPSTDAGASCATTKEAAPEQTEGTPTALSTKMEGKLVSGKQTEHQPVRLASRRARRSLFLVLASSRRAWVYGCATVRRQ